MLGWEAWFTICVILVMFIVLLFDLAPSDFTMLAALATLMAAQIVTTNEGLAGFSNSAGKFYLFISFQMYYSHFIYFFSSNGGCIVCCCSRN